MNTNTSPLFPMAASRGAIAAALAVTLAACGSSPGSESPDSVTPAPGSASVNDPGPATFAGGPYTLSGETLSFATGMVAGADIDIWVQSDGFGYSYRWANGRLRSDELGRFEARVRPSQVTVLAFASGFVQPCAVKSSVQGNTAVRVELVPVTDLDADEPPPPQLSSEPSLSGMVYETTTEGRQPIAGASLWAEHLPEVPQATTVSNRRGGYFLCNLGSSAALYVGKAGYETRYIEFIDASTPQVLDVELRRLPVSAVH